MFKERKNKAPYLKHYCRGMTDRQISNITGWPAWGLMMIAQEERSASTTGPSALCF